MENFVNKFEQYKQRQNEMVNEFNIKKLDYQRESNLLKQQIDFLNKKNNDIMGYSEEIDKQHEENINELKTELEENFNNKLNELINEKMELNEKVKEYESQLKGYEDKISELTRFYEDKLNEEKNNHKTIYENLENELMKLSKETEILQKKSNDPIKKINELLEIQSQLQNENSNFKDKIHKLEKEKEEKEKFINSIEKDKNDLLIENENLNTTISNLEQQLKIKVLKNTVDLRKKFKNMGQNSREMLKGSMNSFDKLGNDNNNNNNIEEHNVLNSFVGDLVQSQSLNTSNSLSLKKNNNNNNAFPMRKNNNKV